MFKTRNLNWQLDILQKRGEPKYDELFYFSHFSFNQKDLGLVQKAKMGTNLCFLSLVPLKAEEKSKNQEMQEIQHFSLFSGGSETIKHTFVSTSAL